MHIANYFQHIKNNLEFKKHRNIETNFKREEEEEEENA